MINADYATFFSNLPLEKINLMEVHLLRLFNFSVEITREEYEKMNKTIQDLNNAATIMHLRMVTPLLSPHVTESGGVSISGRRAFHRKQTLEDEDEQEQFYNSSALGSPAVLALTSSDLDLIGDEITPKNTARSCKSISGDLEDMHLPSVKSSSVIAEKFESIPEDLLEERPVTRHKRRTSVQIAVDNALSVLVKYLPRSSSKIHITNETKLS
jgi:hypothetical protein